MLQMSETFFCKRYDRTSCWMWFSLVSLMKQNISPGNANNHNTNCKFYFCWRFNAPLPRTEKDKHRAICILKFSSCTTCWTWVSRKDQQKNLTLNAPILIVALYDANSQFVRYSRWLIDVEGTEILCVMEGTRHGMDACIKAVSIELVITPTTPGRALEVRHCLPAPTLLEV